MAATNAARAIRLGDGWPTSMVSETRPEDGVDRPATPFTPIGHSTTLALICVPFRIASRDSTSALRRQGDPSRGNDTRHSDGPAEQRGRLACEASFAPVGQAYFERAHACKTRTAGPRPRHPARSRSRRLALPRPPVSSWAHKKNDGVYYLSLYCGPARGRWPENVRAPTACEGGSITSSSSSSSSPPTPPVSPSSCQPAVSCGKIACDLMRLLRWCWCTAAGPATDAGVPRRARHRERTEQSGALNPPMQACAGTRKPAPERGCLTQTERRLRPLGAATVDQQWDNRDVNAAVCRGSTGMQS